MRAPPEAYACEGAKLDAGEHLVGVEIADKPASLMLRTMSLPAFDKEGSGVSFGAHVRVWVHEDLIIIDPPTVSSRPML
jgi:hypothetical protein